ncbi:hypothetical protein ACF1BQ_006400 [Bradyrhizobium sp. RDT10]
MALAASQYAAQAATDAPQAFHMQRWHFITVRCVPNGGADCTMVAEDSIRALARSFDRPAVGNVNAKVSNSKGIKRAMTCIPTG